MAVDPNKPGLSMQDATEIALKEVQKEEGWPAANMIGEGKKTEDGFEITVWRTPKFPGGFRLLVISSVGKITAYYRGK